MSKQGRRARIAAMLITLASTPVLAQGGFVVPNLHGTYQTKLELLNSGSVPKLFLGTASVAPDRSQPYVVSLGLKDVRTELGHYCGGVIVDPHWVLTAAHCASSVLAVDGKNVITPLEPGKAQVREGSNVLFRGGRIRSISKIVIHPDHRLAANRVPENDLALISSPHRLIQSRSVSPPHRNPGSCFRVARASAFLDGAARALP